jgi:hypothetical protein
MRDQNVRERQCTHGPERRGARADERRTEEPEDPTLLHKRAHAPWYAPTSMQNRGATPLSRSSFNESSTLGKVTLSRMSAVAYSPMRAIPSRTLRGVTARSRSAHCFVLPCVFMPFRSESR